MKKSYSLCVLLFITVIMFSCGNNSKQQNPSTSSEKNVYTEPEHNCSECYATKVESKMIHSTGDVISEGKEYWVCKDNNMKCINSRYEKVKNNKENACEFRSGGDVLAYLIGKTFTQENGSIDVLFKESGALISGLEYQWQNYESLGGYKGMVKLNCIDPSNPDGTITLWVSCRENSITDGNIVLLYN